MPHGLLKNYPDKDHYAEWVDYIKHKVKKLKGSYQVRGAPPALAESHAARGVRTLITGMCCSCCVP
jgi:hypothetical protein